MSRESAVKSFPALTVPPSLRTHGRSGNASRLRVGPLRPRRGPKGIRPRGGANLGRQRPLRGIAQMLLQPPKPSLLVGRDWQPWNQAFRPSGRKWPPCLPVSRDASRRPIPQVPKPTSPVIAMGVLAVERSFPKSHLLASSPVGGCWARRPCHSLVGTPGCDLSDPSHVMEPRGPANHTATAMDPVHGFQSGFDQAEFTLTTQRGAVLRSGYGSEGTGEVSMGMGSTAFAGHQSQPGDAARQPFPVIDSALSGVSAPSGVSALPGVSALSGVSALPGVSALQGLSALSGVSAFSGLSALPGQSIHSATVHGDTPMEVEMGSALAGPSAPRPCRTPGAFHFQVSLSCPGPSLLSRESGHPRDSPAPLWGPGNFQGRGKRQPSGRHRPSTLVGLGPTGQRPP